MTLELPNPPSGPRLAVRVSHDALRQVRGGHPWVFDTSLRSVSREGAPGDLAVIFDDRREFAAIGLWDPASPIRIRILHHGRPRSIDRSFWYERLTRAVSHRAPLVRSGQTTGFRLVHGENDGMPGLVVDQYGDTSVMKLYSAAWFPHLGEVVPAWTDAAEAQGVCVDRLVLRLARNVRGDAPTGVGDGAVVIGDRPEGPVPFLEHGLRFEADVIGGQKTGHFLDQRDNRVMVGEFAEGCRVLDVFACTGGFSVHAAAGGAREVTSVDLSRRSLDTASRNWSHNLHVPAVAGSRHRTVVGDAFEVLDELRRAGRFFDLVVVDPPSFAHRRRDRERALAAYERLAGLGLELVAEGGRYVQSSCSSRIDQDELLGAVGAGARRAGRRLRLERQTAHALDHPIGFAHGAYLTTVVARTD